MQSASKILPVKFGFFWTPKPLNKQSFENDIGELVLKVCELGELHDNLRARNVIREAGDVAISLITGLWEDPCKLNDIYHLKVVLNFNNDYTDWLVKVEYPSFSSTKVFHAQSPNYDKAIEDERKELFERYGFKDEVDSRVWMVSFRGKQAEMNSDELMKFRAEFGYNSDLIIQEKKT